MNEPATIGQAPQEFNFGRQRLFLADAFDWLAQAPRDSVHAVVTDPPYGVIEYLPEQLRKLRIGRGGVWRIPPTFDGASRKPLPRFTVLGEDGRKAYSTSSTVGHDWSCQLCAPAHMSSLRGTRLSRHSLPLLSSGQDSSGEANWCVSSGPSEAGTDQRGHTRSFRR